MFPKDFAKETRSQERRPAVQAVRVEEDYSLVFDENAVPNTTANVAGLFLRAAGAHAKVDIKMELKYDDGQTRTIEIDRVTGSESHEGVKVIFAQSGEEEIWIGLYEDNLPRFRVAGKSGWVVAYVFVAFLEQTKNGKYLALMHQLLLMDGIDATEPIYLYGFTKPTRRVDEHGNAHFHTASTFFAGRLKRSIKHQFTGMIDGKYVTLTLIPSASHEATATIRFSENGFFDGQEHDVGGLVEVHDPIALRMDLGEQAGQGFVREIDIGAERYEQFIQKFQTLQGL